MTLLQRGRTIGGWRGALLDIFLGGFAVLGHAPFHIWPLSILCFSLFLIRLDASRQYRKKGFRLGFNFGLGYFLLGTFWIGSAFIVRGPEFIPAMPPMILGLAAILSLFWGVSSFIYARFAGDGLLRWPTLAALLTVGEFARGHVLGGLPWNLPGYIFESGSYMSQTAAFIGIYGLSFLVLLMSSLLAMILVSEKRSAAGGILLILVGAAFSLGHIRLSQAEPAYVENVKLRIVQVPFSQKEKFERESSIAIVNEFLKLSVSPGVGEITHIVWPEGAVVGMALENGPLLSAMGQLLSYETDSPPYWLLNTLRYELESRPGETPREHYYNTSAVIAFSKTGNPAVVNLNDKQRLVPFGEFIPGGRWVEELGSKTLSTSLASISAAKEKTLAHFPGLPVLSPQICYEIIFSGFMPRPKDGRRAQWILNQSNDAWFGKRVGPAQHANIAAYRAIEEGVPIVRSASNGISGIIDPYGRYTQKLSPADKGVLDVKLPQALSTSHLSDKFNSVLFLILLAISVIGLALSRDRKTVEQEQ